MAWNPGPEVSAARDFGKKFDADRVVMHTTPGHVDDADSNDLARDLAEANADCRCLTYWLMASWAVTFGAIGWAAWVTKLHFFP